MLQVWVDHLMSTVLMSKRTCTESDTAEGDCYMRPLPPPPRFSPYSPALPACECTVWLNCPAVLWAHLHNLLALAVGFCGRSLRLVANASMIFWTSSCKDHLGLPMFRRCSIRSDLLSSTKGQSRPLSLLICGYKETCGEALFLSCLSFEDALCVPCCGFPSRHRRGANKEKTKMPPVRKGSFGRVRPCFSCQVDSDAYTRTSGWFLCHALFFAQRISGLHA